MNAKAYLSEIRTYKKAMRSLEMKCEELRVKASGVGAIVYDKDKVQVSPANMMENIVAELVEVEERYGRTIVKYFEAVRLREEQIANMDNPLHSEILRMRYIDDGKDGNAPRLEEIAYRTNRSFSSVAHLHGDALQAFKKKYLR